MIPYLDQLQGLGPHGLTVLVLCCAGAAMKLSKWFNDGSIPSLLMLFGAIGFPLLARKADVDYTGALIAYNAAMGAALGWASVGAHQVMKQTFPLLFPKSEDTAGEKEE
jgi:hypothetical protein